MARGRADKMTAPAHASFPNTPTALPSQATHIPHSTTGRDLWQDSFTSIGTASLSYLYMMPARENTYQDDSPLKPHYQMPNMDCSQGRQGIIMRIYDQCITFERREFLYDQPLGDKWLLPWPISKHQPLTFHNRAKQAPVPQFDPYATANVTNAYGKNRYGTEQQQLTLHFPNVLKKWNRLRAFDFEVQVEYQWLDAIFVSSTKRVFSPHAFLGEAQDQGEVTCIFGLSELPSDHLFRFAIRPCECFGKKGNPLYTDWLDPSSVHQPASLTTEKSSSEQANS